MGATESSLQARSPRTVSKSVYVLGLRVCCGLKCKRSTGFPTQAFFLDSCTPRIAERRDTVSSRCCCGYFNGMAIAQACGCMSTWAAQHGGFERSLQTDTSRCQGRLEHANCLPEPSRRACSAAPRAAAKRSKLSETPEADCWDPEHSRRLTNK